jgi:hypothetical protein
MGYRDQAGQLTRRMPVDFMRTSSALCPALPPR